MVDGDFPLARRLLAQIWAALDGDPAWLDRVEFQDRVALRAPLAVTDLAAASFAVAGVAVAELLSTAGCDPPAVTVGRAMASEWFRFPVAPSRPLVLEPVSVPLNATMGPWMTEFATADGRWLRLQGLYPTQRTRIARALGVPEDIDAVARVIARRNADEVEQAIVDEGGTAAASRTIDQWLAHPQGRAVNAEPVVEVKECEAAGSSWRPTPGRPLGGLRVLDLTRVVAGPMGTRFLAACGAEVLRLDAPDSDEATSGSGRGTDLVLGKRWAALDLRTRDGHDRFLQLLADADVLVHGYRPGGLDKLVPPDERRAHRPGLVEVTANAYGWTGPWQMRRGFDTLTQFSTGIANEVQTWALEDPDRRVPIISIGFPMDASRPRLLPVEALDFATGYQIAAAAVRGITRRQVANIGSLSQLSLARTAALLLSAGRRVPEEPEIAPQLDGPYESRIHFLAGQPVRHLAFPLEITGNPLFWDRPVDRVGSSTASWSTPTGSDRW